MNGAEKDCKSPECQCDSKTPFESIAEREFYVYDPGSDDNKSTEPCKIVFLDKDHLTVVNGGNSPVIFVKTDKCLIPENVSKCDCVLFNQEKMFFVEIKKSNSAERGKQRNKAIKQLEATITWFRENGPDPDKFESFAFICFKSKTKRTTQSSFYDKQVDFQRKTNVRLEEANEISF
jgi:hypothetical protein